MLAEALQRHDAMDPPAAWRAMQRAVRNIGRDGLAATAISAVDTALWDLKAKLLELPLALLFGRYREPCRSTAAAVSPPTPTMSCASS